VIVALFNPAQLRYDTRAEWRAQGSVAQSVAAGYQRMEFQATPPTTLAIELLFDTSEGAPQLEALAARANPDMGSGIASAVDVRTYTAAVAKLARVQTELHRPPVCELQWGKAKLFTGVLTQLHQDFSFFLSDGTPIRATLSCTFMTYRTFKAAAADVELHSSDVVKRRVIRRGDTLDRIAAQEYGDPAAWKEIARYNDIDDPRHLAPGRWLVLPKRRGAS
jgi:nucleoid-associated protein YgaU